jgi:hypothetical protein
MYHFEIAAPGNDKAPLKYRYLVGAHQVGIITPSRKRHLFPIYLVSGRPEGSRTGEENGSADARLTASEVAAFVLRNNLK